MGGQIYRGITAAPIRNRAVLGDDYWAGLALANEGDVLIGISTSGNSESILSAIMAAREKGCQTIGLTGEKGKKLASLCDAAVLVPSARTARIQEGHITIGHIWCEMVDIKLRESGLTN